MGSGKTTWTINNLLNQNLNENILYITPYLDEVKRIKNATDRKMVEHVFVFFLRACCQHAAEYCQWQYEMLYTHDVIVVLLII